MSQDNSSIVSEFADKCLNIPIPRLSFRDQARQVGILSSTIKLFKESVQEKLEKKAANRQDDIETNIYLQNILVLKVLVNFRNKLKILQENVAMKNLPILKRALFSWSFKEFKNRMELPNRNYLDKFNQYDAATKQRIKMNSDIATITRICETLLHDTMNEGIYYDSEIMISDMHKLLMHQNESMAKFGEQQRLFGSLKRQFTISDENFELEKKRQTELFEDDVDFEVCESREEAAEQEMRFYSKSQLTLRYEKSYMDAQYNQLKFQSDQTKEGLINLINYYNRLYLNEDDVMHSIEKANQHIINGLEDEVSMLSQKYEFDCERLDLQLNQKRNELMALRDRHGTMELKYQELINDIGDDVFKEVEPATMTSVLNKVIQAELERKLAAAQAKGKKGKKGGKGKKGKKQGGEKSDKGKKDPKEKTAKVKAKKGK